MVDSTKKKKVRVGSGSVVLTHMLFTLVLKMRCYGQPPVHNQPQVAAGRRRSASAAAVGGAEAMTAHQWRRTSKRRCRRWVVSCAGATSRGGDGS